jgi:hypothetical protein
MWFVHGKKGGETAKKKSIGRESRGVALTGARRIINHSL